MHSSAVPYPHSQTPRGAGTWPYVEHGPSSGPWLICMTRISISTLQCSIQAAAARNASQGCRCFPSARPLPRPLYRAATGVSKSDTVELCHRTVNYGGGARDFPAPLPARNVRYFSRDVTAGGLPPAGRGRTLGGRRETSSRTLTGSCGQSCEDCDTERRHFGSEESGVGCGVEVPASGAPTVLGW